VSWAILWLEYPVKYISWLHGLEGGVVWCGVGVESYVRCLSRGGEVVVCMCVYVLFLGL
jgi:hypothetical protein